MDFYDFSHDLNTFVVADHLTGIVVEFFKIFFSEFFIETIE